MTTNPIPAEAVEAAALAEFVRRGWKPDVWNELTECDRIRWREMVRPALTAAAPLIAAQAAADLRAGIEAMRDAWWAGRCTCLTCTGTRRHADALDALLREGE